MQQPLPPFELIERGMKEFAGYGYIFALKWKVRGSALFFHQPNPTIAKTKFFIQVTPVEEEGWEEFQTPPLFARPSQVKVGNGWFRIVTPSWGQVAILPGNMDFQRILATFREQEVPLLIEVTRRDNRNIFVHFAEERVVI